MNILVNISLIVAASENNIIGKGLNLPWRISPDMAYFKEKTTGKPVIMGRRTFESFGGRLLPNRLNIAVSRNRSFGMAYPDLIVCGSLENAIGYAKAESKETKEIFIIGGGELYKEALDKRLVDTVYITRVFTTIPETPDCVYFTGFYPDRFRTVELSSIRTDIGTKSNSGLQYRFERYERLPS